ncbi:MAG: efflux RND transporter periplasmic adaptor subunit [Nitrosomonas sp.]|jgi:RND family efflux transporter MFP subunit|nr:efflux RND transporter periplasmic adaptor subunit [Nitrosomonas sp.]
MKLSRQLLIALSIAITGGSAAFAIMRFPPQTDQQEEVITKPPFVQVLPVTFTRLRMDVRSQGRVNAQTEIDLVAGVSGNIISISSAFVSGGIFKKGDLLVAIDPAEYDLRVAQAQARVMEAQYQLTREEAEAEQARDEWQQLGQGEPNPLNLRIPQLREKKAKLAAEQEELKNARLLRQRTDIRAPFNGRVRSKEAGLGQYISSGAVLGRIYSTDLAEIRLPVSTRELAFIDLAGLSGQARATPKIPVTLTANYQGQQQTWIGHIARSEDIIDEETGMTMLVAQVQDPFRLGAGKSRSSRSESPQVNLPIGLFVEARIEGRWLDDLVVLPASALFKDSQVAVIDPDNRLRLHTVDILRREQEQEQVIIRISVNPGERVLVSGLHHPVDGMQVTPVVQENVVTDDTPLIP